MPRPSAPEASLVPYPVGPHPIDEGTLVGLDGEGLLVPVDRAARFVGVASESHPGTSERGGRNRVEVAAAGSFVLGFAGWIPSLADLGRAVWAFSPWHVAGAPLRTSLAVGRIVAIATARDGGAGVRVELDRIDSGLCPPTNEPTSGRWRPAPRSTQTPRPRTAGP